MPKEESKGESRQMHQIHLRELVDKGELEDVVMWVATKHKFIHFVHEIALLDHWNRLGESFPTMYGSVGCLWLAGSEYRV